MEKLVKTGQYWIKLTNTYGHLFKFCAYDVHVCAYLYVLGCLVCVSLCLWRSEVSLGIQCFLSTLSEMGLLSCSLPGWSTPSWRFCFFAPYVPVRALVLQVRITVHGFWVSNSAFHSCVPISQIPFSILKSVSKCTSVRHVVSRFMFSMM